MIEVEIPIKTVSEANMREHWSVKHKRVKAQHEAVKWMLGLELIKQDLLGKLKLPLKIGFTRIAPRKLDKDDNLNISFKAIRDQVAKTIGFNDGDDRVTWDYQQEKGKEYAVKIRIEQL